MEFGVGNYARRNPTPNPPLGYFPLSTHFSLSTLGQIGLDDFIASVDPAMHMELRRLTFRRSFQKGK